MRIWMVGLMRCHWWRSVLAEWPFFIVTPHCLTFKTAGPSVQHLFSLTWTIAVLHGILVWLSSWGKNWTLYSDEWYDSFTVFIICIMLTTAILDVLLGWTLGIVSGFSSLFTYFVLELGWPQVTLPQIFFHWLNTMHIRHAVALTITLLLLMLPRRQIRFLTRLSRIGILFPLVLNPLPHWMSLNARWRKGFCQAIRAWTSFYVSYLCFDYVQNTVVKQGPWWKQVTPTFSGYPRSLSATIPWCL